MKVFEVNVLDLIIYLFIPDHTIFLLVVLYYLDLTLWTKLDPTTCLFYSSSDITTCNLTSDSMRLSILLTFSVKSNYSFKRNLRMYEAQRHKSNNCIRIKIHA